MTSPEIPMAPRLKGAPNFRDLAGVRRADGRRLIPGALYRSDKLSSLTEADLRLLGRLAPRLICDLRNPKERAAEPNCYMGESLEQLCDESLGDIQTDSGLLEALREDPSATNARRQISDFYRRLPALLHGSLSQLAQRLAGGYLPVVVHCAAGKDRTGFVIAMLLLALGVVEEDVEADYLLTAQRQHRQARIAALGDLIERHTGTRMGPDVCAEIITPRLEHLSAAFTAITHDYGSREGYFASVGLTETVSAALADRLFR